MTDNRAYLEGIRDEIYSYFDGLEEDGETLNLYDYIANKVLDVTYIINSDKTYKAVELCVGFGGPNVYVNTRSQTIELYWGTDHESIWLPSEVCDELDSIYDEFYTEA